MAEAVIDPGGGGTTSSICAVSPSDMMGQINNLVSRVEQLEQDVAELKALNIGAVQLSDFSASVGWVYDVVYMGIPGWTQTPYGTLIPPAGMSLSSLGIVPPTIPGLSGGGGISNYLICNPSTATITSNAPNISNVIASHGSSIGTSHLSSGQIDITADGLYLVNIHLLADSFSAGSGYKYMQVAASGMTAVRSYLYSNGSPSTDTHKPDFDADFAMPFVNGDVILITFSGVSSLMGSVYTNSRVSVMKLN